MLPLQLFYTHKNVYNVNKHNLTVMKLKLDCLVGNTSLAMMDMGFQETDIAGSKQKIQDRRSTGIYLALININNVHNEEK